MFVVLREHAYRCACKRERDKIFIHCWLLKSIILLLLLLFFYYFFRYEFCRIFSACFQTSVLFLVLLSVAIVFLWLFFVFLLILTYGKRLKISFFLFQDPARACYGPKHVEVAHERMAIQTLLITDDLFRYEKFRGVTYSTFTSLVLPLSLIGLGRAYLD